MLLSNFTGKVELIIKITLIDIKAIRDRRKEVSGDEVIEMFYRTRADIVGKIAYKFKGLEEMYHNIRKHTKILKPFCSFFLLYSIHFHFLCRNMPNKELEYSYESQMMVKT